MFYILTKINYAERSYQVYIRGITNDKLLAKFDTGAVEAMMSLSCMLGEYNPQEEDRFRRYVIDNKIIHTYFNAANGGMMECYPVCAKDVKIGNIAISEFHYYLTVGVERRTFLLDDDFISCCTFSHAYNSDILINGFNNNRYVENLSIRNI